MLVGLAVSMFFGLWHFIIPYQYRLIQLHPRCTEGRNRLY